MYSDISTPDFRKCSGQIHPGIGERAGGSLKAEHSRSSTGRQKRNGVWMGCQLRWHILALLNQLHETLVAQHVVKVRMGVNDVLDAQVAGFG